jgi:hypothetical protein
MQSKTKTLATLLRTGVCAIFALGAVAVQAQDQKIDPNGTWTWTNPGRGGNPGATVSLKLKADGSKLTGTITLPPRGGNGDPMDIDISNGKIDGDHISFEIVRDTQNGSVTNKYDGKIAGDTITGTQPGGRRGRRGGGGGMAGGGTNAPSAGGGSADGSAPPPPPAPTTRPWTATRSTT